MHPRPSHTHTRWFLHERNTLSVMRPEYIHVKVTHMSSVIILRVVWNSDRAKTGFDIWLLRNEAKDRVTRYQPRRKRSATYESESVD
jgi:hypothetical protein